MNKTKIISYINFLGCIGWSIFGLVLLLFLLIAAIEEELKYGLITEEAFPFFLIFALFATTASGIILYYEDGRNVLVQLWKIKKQPILWIGIVVILAMCLFPPFISEQGESMGYAYLFSDIILGESPHQSHAHIDFAGFIIQCAIVGLITGALLYTLKDKKTETARK